MNTDDEPDPLWTGGLQPDDDPNQQLPNAGLESALDRIEDTKEAEHLARIVGDSQLILRLQLSGFDTATPDWAKLSDALIEYGYSVFLGWGRTGNLRIMASQHGRGGVQGLSRIPSGLDLVHDEAHELAIELVVAALPKFRRDALMHPDPNRRWSSTGGASLRTFFVGKCLMELPDVYEKWNRQRTRWSDELVQDPNQFDPASSKHMPHTNPTSAIAAVDLDRLPDLDPLTRELFALQDEGYTYAEMATMLTDIGRPHTEGSIRSKLFRERKNRRESQLTWNETKSQFDPQ